MGPSIVLKTVLEIFAKDKLLYHYGDIPRNFEPYKCPCHVCLPPSQTVTEPELLVEHAKEPQTVVEVDVHAVGVRATIEPVEADSIRVKPARKYLVTTTG